ncbi:MAG: hypothetical protein LBC80_09765, partial [Treponema sp.]|jgi:histidinol dehydrogenase|nr:hypothetical protein [Treponema sp.]
VFSLEQMADDLRSVISAVRQQNIPIKDICFSGNGEPTLSPVFGSALKLAENIRTQMAPAAQLVIITNGTGLLQQQVFSLLTKTAQAAEANCLDIWLKLDAGTSDWYQKMNRCITPFEEHITKIKEFTSCTSVTIQTMLCTINGELPPESEVQAWETLVNQLAASSPGIRKVQLYGKARSAPEDPLASQAPAEYLESRAESLRCAFEKKGITVPVEVYL